ncbi:hypothetical protein RJ639_034251 [Escallonia herrerae]|uniref:Cupin type-1 domain-containing protein n=1 Tax=Escallonia herrerae TaxID=1293975 RepID=A0AA88WZ19_9ASTE|nr:hypothetical protein RJ639_034251 [Escallonia herrerae]
MTPVRRFLKICMQYQKQFKTLEPKQLQRVTLGMHVSTGKPRSPATPLPLYLFPVASPLVSVCNVCAISAMMMKSAKVSPFSFRVLLFLYFVIVSAPVAKSTACGVGGGDGEDVSCVAPPVVKKSERRSLASSEYGEITAAKVGDGTKGGSYHLQFITLEPNALFLPVLLHADMVFFVQTGGGRLSWTDEDPDEDELRRMTLRRGDSYRLRPGTVFFIQSNLEPDRQKLRIYAIFATSNSDLREPPTGPYSSILDLLLGFDKNVLQAAFEVPEEVIEEITSGTQPPAIVHGVPWSKRTLREIDAQFMKAILGSRGYSMFDVNNKKEKTKLYNIFKEDPDVKNCNGWSTTVTRRKLNALRGSDFGIFMVNLTTGSMMGPHWNPMATEIVTVLQGRGMVRVVCSSMANEKECKNARYRVEEGDVFAVPRYHPMAQISFNNDTFVFAGFTTASRRNHPQFLAGKSSVLQTLDKQVLASSFNVPNSTIDRLLAPQRESIILACTSCAEEEERILQEEIQKGRDEAREREEAAARRREEEARREEAARKKEEEEARKREEERRKEEEEEAREREEQEAREREEEKREEEEKRREKEEARRREEEKREEEATREREEEARKREEEARQRKEGERRKEEEGTRETEEEQAQEEEERKQEEVKREEEERQEEEGEGQVEAAFKAMREELMRRTRREGVWA